MRKLLSLFALFLPRAALAQDRSGQVTFEGGIWETSAELVAVEGPGVTDVMRERLRASLQSLHDRSCSGGTTDPIHSFRDSILAGFLGRAPDGNCTFTDTGSSPGRLRTTAQCSIPGYPVNALAQIDAAYTGMSVTANMTVELQPHGTTAVSSRFVTRISSHRTGPCTATSGGAG